jgi:hypothetical protein
LIALGDAGGHETGKQGNRFADPGPEKLPNYRAIGSRSIDTEVYEGTAGASSNAIDSTTRPRSPGQSFNPRTDTRRRTRATFNPIAAVRHNRGSGNIDSGDCFQLGIIPAKTAA